MWFAGLASAFMIKLTSSIDDVVWLAPFLTSNVSFGSRVWNAAIYTTVCLTQTLVAMFMAQSGNAAVEYFLRNYPNAWSSDKILTVTAGSLLAVYAVKLTYEFCTEDSEGDEPEASTYQKVPVDDDQEPDEPRPPLRSAFCCGGRFVGCGSGKVAPDLPDDGVVEDGAGEALDEEAADEARSPSKTGPKDDDDRSQTLFVIAFIGSVDDLTVFVPMLVGKAFDLAQLVIGAFFAALFIVLVCIFIGMCKPVADCLSSVPLALIVAVFATSLLAKGMTME